LQIHQNQNIVFKSVFQIVRLFKSLNFIVLEKSSQKLQYLVAKLVAVLQVLVIPNDQEQTQNQNIIIYLLLLNDLDEPFHINQ